MQRVILVFLMFGISGKPLLQQNYTVFVLMLGATVLEFPWRFLRTMVIKHTQQWTLNKHFVLKMYFLYVSLFCSSQFFYCQPCSMSSHCIQNHTSFWSSLLSFTWSNCDGVWHSEWGCSTAFAVQRYLLLVLTSFTFLFINDLTLLKNCNSQEFSFK